MATFTGDTCTGGTWNRPVANAGDPPYYLSEFADAVNFAVHEWTPACDGSVDFLVEGFTDIYLFLYIGSFDETDPLCGYSGTPPPDPCCLIGNVDCPPDSPVPGQACFTYDVTVAGAPYYLVVTAFENGECGEYSLTVTEHCCTSIFGSGCASCGAAARPAARLPGPGRMALNVAGAMATVARAAAGRLAEGRRPVLLAPEKVVAERLGICGGCEWFSRGRCRKCGCWLGKGILGKARLAAMSGPLIPPKWGSWKR